MSIINLLPEDYMQKRAQRRANAVCLVLFVVVMAAVVGADLVSRRATADIGIIRAQVDRDYTEAAKLVGQLQDLRTRRTTMLNQAKYTASLMEPVPRSYLLAMLINSLPEGMSLIRFSLDTVTVLPPAPPAGEKAQATGNAKFDSAMKGRSQPKPTLVVEMEVTGLAHTDVEVARLIARLARNGLTDSVDLVYSQEKKIEEAEVREFRIRLRLREGADVLDLRKDPNAAPGASPRLASLDPEAAP